MPELIFQLLPLALTPLAAVVPNGVQRCIILGLAVLYFGVFVVRPNLPSVRMKKLEQYIDETVNMHAISVQELDKNPRFTAEASWRLAKIKFSESVLRSKTLAAKQIAWKDYIQYLRWLSSHIAKCQDDVQDIRTLILATLESNRQRRYMDDIVQRQTTLETVFVSGSSSNPLGYV
ncbi:hypothetical protein B0H17DRAFT_1044905 [Mycena rosella]|uniref:ATP synthase protein MI25 n=1 Tax=Mycena rosella TaxID=1033263 RepID=A0AAD7DYB1_MYCRO|nr:hypothetical protein B0H17DRAFT_1044905 [Mycena rosella]